MIIIDGDGPDIAPSRIAWTERAKWTERWNFGFRKSKESGKPIWPFTKAMQGVAVWTGPGVPVVETKWMLSVEYTYLKLKGKI